MGIRSLYSYIKNYLKVGHIEYNDHYSTIIVEVTENIVKTYKKNGKVLDIDLTISDIKKTLSLFKYDKIVFVFDGSSPLYKVRNHIVKRLFDDSFDNISTFNEDYCKFTNNVITRLKSIYGDSCVIDDTDNPGESDKKIVNYINGDCLVITSDNDMYLRLMIYHCKNPNNNKLHLYNSKSSTIDDIHIITNEFCYLVKDKNDRLGMLESFVISCGLFETDVSFGNSNLVYGETSYVCKKCSSIKNHVKCSSIFPKVILFLSDKNNFIKDEKSYHNFVKYMSGFFYCSEFVKHIKYTMGLYSIKNIDNLLKSVYSLLNCHITSGNSVNIRNKINKIEKYYSISDDYKKPNTPNSVTGNYMKVGIFLKEYFSSNKDFDYYLTSDKQPNIRSILSYMENNAIYNIPKFTSKYKHIIKDYENVKSVLRKNIYIDHKLACCIKYEIKDGVIENVIALT